MRILWLVALLSGLGWGVCAAADDAWLIAPGERVGPITATTSEDDLRRLFGDAAVVRAPIEIGEGVREDGTIVHPGDATRKLEVLWKDAAARRAPSRIQITGDASEWHLAGGITLGTTLRDLEALNGRPFMLAGFGWDYGGTIVSWEGGALSPSGGGGLFLRLTPDYTDPADQQLENDVLGDRDFPSSHPAMQRIDPTVYQIIVGFPLD